MSHRDEINFISFQIELVDHAIITHTQFELVASLKSDVMIALQSAAQISDSILNALPYSRGERKIDLIKLL